MEYQDMIISKNRMVYSFTLVALVFGFSLQSKAEHVGQAGWGAASCAPHVGNNVAALQQVLDEFKDSEELKNQAQFQRQIATFKSLPTTEKIQMYLGWVGINENDRNQVLAYAGAEEYSAYHGAIQKSLGLDHSIAERFARETVDAFVGAEKSSEK